MTGTTPAEQERANRSALNAAAARGAHLVVDQAPFIFEDTLALPLGGEKAEESLAFHRSNGSHVILAGTRLAVTARSRYTEARLADATSRGAGQYVILGAGLDSFAYRSVLARQLSVFEVDHPATQEWKRQRLAAAGITIPDNLKFAPVDLRTDSLAEGLARAGFNAARNAFVSWLGVTFYLTGESIATTLDAVAGFAPGTELVADYVLPAELRDEAGRAYAGFALQVNAASGEPWLSFYSPPEMERLLEDHGLGVIEQLGQRDWVEPAMWQRTDTLQPSELFMLVRAAIRPRSG